MARQLDSEDQEKLEELKLFWNKYGNLITWALIAVLGGYAAWNGWHYWQNRQAVQASALYDEVVRAAETGDIGRVEQGFHDARDQFGGTSYAHQAALLAAKVLAEKGKPQEARAALQWVAEDASSDGYQAIARLRLAALLVQDKAYDQALQQLASGLPAEFEPLAADRRGDIYQLQGKKDEARAEYTKAFKGLGAESEYRGLVAVKLTALGVDVQQLEGAKT